MMNIINKNKAFILSVIVLSVALCASLMFTSNDNISTENNVNNINYKDRISGFSKDTKLETEYLFNKKNIYSVYYTIKQNKNKFIDVELLLNKQSNALKAVISGLPKDSKISLSGHQNTYDQSVPVDWAGRLTLRTNYFDYNNEQEICISFDQANTPTKAQKLCHNFNYKENKETYS